MSGFRLIGIYLALITLVVYLPVTRHEFVCYDDEVYVTGNGMVQQGLTMAGAKWAFTTFRASNWHPLTWLSHMADCELFDLTSGAHHLVNALFHAANTALLFVLLWRLTGLLQPAALVAALFAWHPLHVESVAWVAERKDVLSTFFGLLALLSYTKFAKEKCPRSYGFALVFFALSLLAKPMLVTLPFLLLLLDYWPMKRMQNEENGATNTSPRVEARLATSPHLTPLPLSNAEREKRSQRVGENELVGGCEIRRANLRVRNVQKLIVEKIPFFALTAASCTVTYIAQRAGHAVIALDMLPMGDRFENAVVSIARYLLKIFWPADLSVIYPYQPIPGVMFVASLAALVLISAAVWLARHRSPCWLMGWLWFVGTLVPVIGLVQVGRAAMADRYAYVPSIGLFVALIFGLYELCGQTARLWKILTYGIYLALAICILMTERQLSFWQNSETLFRHALAVTGENEFAHDNLGFALQKQDRIAEALAEYREGLRINPYHSEVHFAAGDMLARLGRPAEALEEYRQCLSLSPDFPNVHSAAGSALAAMGNLPAALSEFAVAEQLAPDYAAPHLELARIYFQRGMDSQAGDELRAAVRLQPGDVHVLNTVAHYLAASTNDAVRNGESAVALALKANELSGNRQPGVFDVLGMAFAATGDFSNAMICAQNALEFVPPARTNDAALIRQRLELYQNHQPWRESFRATNALAQ